MDNWHDNAFDIHQLIRRKLQKPNKWNVEEAEIMALFLKFSHSQSVLLKQAQEQLKFMDSLLTEYEQQLQDTSLIAEREVIKKAYRTVETQEARDALKQWANTLIIPLKNYEARRKNKAGKNAERSA